VRGAVAETLKYSTKPADMVADPEWFLELTRQTHKRRFVATGGMTWQDTRPAHNPLVAGHWPPKTGEVSMEEGLAKRLNVKLGDSV
ncbi:protein rep, partial [Salmonella enterica subsp. enterica serovar Kentucky]|nr:protein rep [Salmonella enterica subsp. enterica serovar Kentucky]